MIRDHPIREEGHVDFLGESEGSLPQPHDSFPDAGEAINDFWSMSGNFIYRHHVEPRVKLYSPREESFPIPLKYIDVSRTTHTNLDVKQEKRIDEQPSKRSKKNDDKSAVAMLKSTRQLGCVFQDMEPPKSSSILRMSSNIRKPIRCVKFTMAIARHADIRDQNPSFGMVCPGEPHQPNPNAPKFEDRSQEETEWQERCAREAAWRLAKSILKLKEKNKAAFFSHSDNVCLPASNLRPEEREFVVDRSVDAHDQQKGLEFC